MAIVSHGATGVGPTLGSKSVTLAAVGIQDELLKTGGHRPSVYFGIFTLSFKPNIERTYKSSLFSLFGIDVGDIINTIGECKAIKKKYGVTINFSGPAKHILLVTDQAHSRRARIVWRAYFKEATVRILAVPLKSVIDPNSPMRIYRAEWRALLVNVILTPPFWFLSKFGERGLNFLTGGYQP